MIITNAKDQTLDPAGGLPDMGDALRAWFRPLTFTVIEKTVVNFQNVEAETDYTTQGVKQPLDARKLEMKPEGQRGWDWQAIHTLPEPELFLDDVMVIGGVRYRVLGKWNWKDYGYIEYHVVQDTQR